MKQVFIISIFLFTIVSIYAQVRTVVYENTNEVYNSRSEFKFESKSIPLKKMPSVDTQKLIAEDRQLEEVSDKPFRFGYGFDVSYTLEDGVWEKRDTTRIWNLKITSAGAYSLNFIFDQLHLGQNTELYIFNTTGTTLYGPVTAEQNITEGTFLTDLMGEASN